MTPHSSNCGGAFERVGSGARHERLGQHWPEIKRAERHEACLVQHEERAVLEPRKRHVFEDDAGLPTRSGGAARGEQGGEAVWR